MKRRAFVAGAGIAFAGASSIAQGEVPPLKVGVWVEEKASGEAQDVNQTCAFLQKELDYLFPEREVIVGPEGIIDSPIRPSAESAKDWWDDNKPDGEWDSQLLLYKAGGIKWFTDDKYAGYADIHGDAAVAMGAEHGEWWHTKKLALHEVLHNLGAGHSDEGIMRPAIGRGEVSYSDETLRQIGANPKT